MKWIMFILTLLGIADLVSGAVTSTDLTETQYTSTLSTSTVAWKIEMTSGFPSTVMTEILVQANGSTSVHHLWSYPEELGIEYDALGYLGVRAGSTVVEKSPSEPFAPILPFNAILIQIGDTSFFGPTELKNSVFNGTAIRNLFAEDNNTANTDYDQLMIQGFGDTFTLDSIYHVNQAGFDRESSLTITGVWVVPEPSSLILALASCGLLLRRQR